MGLGEGSEVAQLHDWSVHGFQEPLMKVELKNEEG